MGREDVRQFCTRVPSSNRRTSMTASAFRIVSFLLCWLLLPSRAFTQDSLPATPEDRQAAEAVFRRVFDFCTGTFYVRRNDGVIERHDVLATGERVHYCELVAGD